MNIEIVGRENLGACGIGCVKTRSHVGYPRKIAWLEDRFDEGLRMVLPRDVDGEAVGFLEYVPGEFAWRPVEAASWLFVHCLWVYSKGQKLGGVGSKLIQTAILEAERLGLAGVATLASEAGMWMAGPSVFRKNGFATLESKDRFELLGFRLRAGEEPRIVDVEANRAALKGLHLVYAPQCPMLPKSVADLKAVASEVGVELQVTELQSAAEARRSPSLYGVYGLVWNGRLLSDHYVSATRFRSILRKEGLGD